MDIHLIDPVTTRNAIAAGFGSFMCLLVTRKLGWINVLSFAVGQVTAYYFTIPASFWLPAWLGKPSDLYGVIGFTIGGFAMLFWNAVMNLAQNVSDDPRGTITWAWRLVRGGAPSDPKNKGAEP